MFLSSWLFIHVHSCCAGLIHLLDTLCQSTAFLKWIPCNLSSAPSLVPDTACRGSLLVHLSWTRQNAVCLNFLCNRSGDRGCWNAREEGLIQSPKSPSSPLSFRSFWKFTNTESTLVFSSMYSSVAVKLEARENVNTQLTWNLDGQSRRNTDECLLSTYRNRKMESSKGVWVAFLWSQGFHLSEVCVTERVMEERTAEQQSIQLFGSSL